MLRFFLVSVLILVNIYAKEDSNPKLAIDTECRVICEKCGFYVWQTDDYFKKLKASNENEDDYYSAMEHWMDYTYLTSEYLAANDIEAFFRNPKVEQCHALIFGTYTLEVSKIDSPFIFIIYQKGKKPHIIQDITIPEDEINSYFNITNP